MTYSSEKPLHNNPVFIVDDDRAILESLERLLKSSGFDCRIFDSVEAFGTSANPDHGLCLVLDVDLNGHSGIAFCRQLTASGSSLPVIFITANDRERVRRDAINAGCVAFLTKPFSSRTFMTAIHKAAALRTSRP
jgi:FixJ family two-component response regulator